MIDRETALAAAAAYYDDGRFLADLTRWVAVPTESQEPTRGPDLDHYLRGMIEPRLADLGFECHIRANPSDAGGPILVARRIEDEALPTVLLYGHGDVVRGLADQWRPGLDPWTVTVEGERIFGRGVVDNKGQHLLAIAALETTLATAPDGKLGVNLAFMIETGEEIGSPGIGEAMARDRDFLKADVFIGLDGPRQHMRRPDIKLGCRGGVAFDLSLKLREGAHHSGHFGGTIADPGILLGHALSTIVDRKGRILVPGWTPEHIPNSVRATLADLVVEVPDNAPPEDPDWGEPGLTRNEKVFAWTSAIVLAFKTGTPERPVNAVQGHATARIQVRHTVDVDGDAIVPALRRHLDAQGFEGVDIHPLMERDNFLAWRTDPDDPWAQFVAASLAETCGEPTNITPNSSGSNPSRLIAEALDVPIIWIPHSYAGCHQHGPDEHGLGFLFRQGMEMMAGLYTDLGTGKAPTTGAPSASR